MKHNHNQQDSPEAQQLNTLLDRMRAAARIERGLPESQREHNGPHHPFNPNHHVENGLIAPILGSPEVGLLSSDYKVEGYDQESAAVTWRFGVNGFSVAIVRDKLDGTVKPLVNSVRYGESWGQWDTPVRDEALAATLAGYAEMLLTSLGC